MSGEILAIQGIDYTFPVRPKLNTMRNYGLPRSQQVWSRRQEYLEWDWDIDSDEWDEDQLSWYWDELDRIYDGEWIIIDGKPTYINGMFYFFLQWFLLENEYYPEYRDTSLEYFMFVEIAARDPLCLGTILIKGRRLGASSMEAAILLRNLLIHRNKRNGIISKTGDDAKDIFGFAVIGFQGLPPFLKPQIEGNEQPKKEISVKKQSARIKKDQKHANQMEGLNNTLNWKATAMNSYDSGKLLRVLVDECLAPNTKVMMADGSFREIKDIHEGDFVMVEGGKSKRVAKRFEGFDNMYRVRQPYGKDYVVNSRHRLYLEQRCRTSSIKDDGIKIMTPVEAMNLGKYRKRTTYRVTSSGLNFSKKEYRVEPYMLGAWLGDGYSNSMSFTINYVDEPEMLNYLEEYCKAKLLKYSIRPTTSDKNVIFSILGRTGRENPYIKELKQLGVYNNKHIPNKYKMGSYEDRLSLLAGILDTDGHKSSKNNFEIGMARLPLIEDIQYLARSLGFSVSEISHSISNKNTDVYKISISGDLGKIPTKITRKQFSDYTKSYNSRRNKIEVVYEGYGPYVGIQVEATNDDDRRLILEDFTLTMNCAKWLEVNIQLYWKVVQKCLTKGAIVVGKASFVSTVNKGDKGGDNFRKLWLDSDPEKRNALGQTSSRLIRIFIPAYKGYEGYIDQFGNSVWDTPTPEQTEYLKTTGCPNPYIGAKEYIQMQRALVEHDPDLLAEEIRTAPFTWQEVFESAANSSYFRNVEELKERKKQLEEQLIGEGLDVLKGEFGRRGWFEFLKNGDAKFVDDPKGIWYVLDLLQDTPDLINRYRVKGLTKDGKKRKVPLNTEWGGAGWDPFAHAQATAEKGSDACCIIRSRYNLLDPENSDKPVAMLLGRMDNKDALHKQLFAGLTYYGVTVLGERAPTDWVDWAESEGYDDYVVETQRKSDGTVVRGINTQGKDAKEAHLTAMVEKSPQDTHKVGFIGIIKDRLDFDPDNRTDFDCAMADGYAIININQPLKKKKQKRTETVFVKRGKISVG